MFECCPPFHKMHLTSFQRQISFCCFLPKMWAVFKLHQNSASVTARWKASCVFVVSSRDFTVCYQTLNETADSLQCLFIFCTVWWSPPEGLALFSFHLCFRENQNVLFYSVKVFEKWGQCHRMLINHDNCVLWKKTFKHLENTSERTVQAGRGRKLTVWQNEAKQVSKLTTLLSSSRGNRHPRV